jgi:hypothetical protein
LSANALRSACRPAPPPESEPAIVMTVTGCIIGSLSTMISWALPMLARGRPEG